MTSDATPVIAAFDDDASARDVLARELARYGAAYTVIVEPAGAPALTKVRALADAGAPVALILADRGSGGAELLAAAHALHPGAKRGLLLRWGENRALREEIVAILDRG